MKKPADSDIFGTKAYVNAPRIMNSQTVNPNTVFQAKMDSQYENYARTIAPLHHQITKPSINLTSVNEQACFDDSYHHNRKNADMRSTIFYETGFDGSRGGDSSRITQRTVPRHAAVDEICGNFGRKQTLSREVSTMPENTTLFKGNCSNLFGYDDKKQRNNVHNRVDKLIPHQMQWDEHDSVRYSEINHLQCPEDGESKSVVLAEQENGSLNERLSGLQIGLNLTKQKENSSNESNKQPNRKQGVCIKDKATVSSQKGVQILVLKGWHSNIMESLSKCCRLNATKIISINFENGGKGTLMLQRSKRWEVVTDWMRRDAKLKIRVK